MRHEMKLRFGKADHGWLPTTLELDGGETLAFTPFPFDALDQLTERVEQARAS